MGARSSALNLNWILIVLYNTGGKWLPCSLLGLLGIYCIGKGIKELKDEW